METSLREKELLRMRQEVLLYSLILLVLPLIMKNLVCRSSVLRVHTLSDKYAEIVRDAIRWNDLFFKTGTKSYDVINKFMYCMRKATSNQVAQYWDNILIK